MSLNWLSALCTRQTICRALSHDAGKAAGRGVSVGGCASATADRALARTALLFAALTMVSLLALAPRTAYAHGGLSLGLRIQQEFYKPLVPVARNFKTCFKTDPATGVQMMSFCTETPNTEAPSAAPNRAPIFPSPARMPAGTAAPAFSPNRAPTSEHSSAEVTGMRTTTRTSKPANLAPHQGQAPTSMRRRVVPYETPAKSNPARRLPQQR